MATAPEGAVPGSRWGRPRRRLVRTRNVRTPRGRSPTLTPCDRTPQPVPCVTVRVGAAHGRGWDARGRRATSSSPGRRARSDRPGAAWRRGRRGGRLRGSRAGGGTHTSTPRPTTVDSARPPGPSPGGTREAHVPAQPTPSGPQAWVPCAHAHPRGARDHQGASSAGPLQAVGLTDVAGVPTGGRPAAARPGRAPSLRA